MKQKIVILLVFMMLICSFNVVFPAKIINNAETSINSGYSGHSSQVDFSTPIILAFYYGWYGDEEQDWFHWDSSNPLGDTTWYIPLLGVYSSLNSSVIEQHIDWAKYAGIDGFIFSWWHGDFERDYFRIGLEMLISIAEGKNFYVTVYLEEEDDEYSVIEQINYLIDHGFCDSVAWYCKDGKPVFYVWRDIAHRYPGSQDKPNGYWSYVRSQIDREIYLNLHHYHMPYEGDGLHDWIQVRDDFRDFGRFNRFLSDVSIINQGEYSLTVNPGFDNTMPGVGGGTQIPRDNGDRYRMQWETVLNIGNKTQYPGYYADEIVIATWNDWHETTSIEPTAVWGLEYLNLTAFYAFNKPPDIPVKPSGSTYGSPGVNYSYNTWSIDLQNEEVYYLWDWGDGNFSDWFGPYSSGETVEGTYVWHENGNYKIRVKAKDLRGAESEWSDPLSVTMPRNRIINSPVLKFLQNIIERFPLFARLLKLL
jgi:hypothetical protein